MITPITVSAPLVSIPLRHLRSSLLNPNREVPTVSLEFILSIWKNLPAHDCLALAAFLLIQLLLILLLIRVLRSCILGR
jgi:hypothetical protein